MRVNQLAKILFNLLESRGKNDIRIVINGAAFPIKQQIWTREGAIYLVANIDHNKSEIVGMNLPKWRKPK